MIVASADIDKGALCQLAEPRDEHCPHVSNWLQQAPPLLPPAAICLGEEDAFRLAASGKLVLHAGQRCLAAHAAAALAEPNPSHLASLKSIAEQQLAAVQSLLVLTLGGEARRRVAAAFSASVAKPASVLPWLESVAGALTLLAARQGAQHLLDCHTCAEMHRTSDEHPRA